MLDLMVHSLYSDPEIFLRELISNASDAADRLRLEALAHPDYYESDPDLKIVIGYDRTRGRSPCATTGSACRATR